MTIRAIRGATSIEVDEQEHLGERTIELIAAVIEQNSLQHDDIVSVLFTCTPDIVSGFPAAAARELGLGDVPLMCAVEMNVAGAMPLVIRLLMTVDTTATRDSVRHIYLHDAVALRRDLAQ